MRMCLVRSGNSGPGLEMVFCRDLADPNSDQANEAQATVTMPICSAI